MWVVAGRIAQLGAAAFDGGMGVSCGITLGSHSRSGFESQRIMWLPNYRSRSLPGRPSPGRDGDERRRCARVVAGRRSALAVLWSSGWRSSRRLTRVCRT